MVRQSVHMVQFFAVFEFISSGREHGPYSTIIATLKQLYGNHEYTADYRLSKLATPIPDLGYLHPVPTGNLTLVIGYFF